MLYGSPPSYYLLFPLFTRLWLHRGSQEHEFGEILSTDDCALCHLRSVKAQRFRCVTFTKRYLAAACYVLLGD